MDDAKMFADGDGDGADDGDDKGVDLLESVESKEWYVVVVSSIQCLWSRIHASRRLTAVGGPSDAARYECFNE